MKIKSIIARFLPLLDVAILLFGLMIVLMTYAHFEKQGEVVQSGDVLTGENRTIVDQHVEMILLHAAPDGKCFRIESGEITVEIDTTSDKDIRSVLDMSQKKLKLILLVSKPGEIDIMWTHEKINELKTTWGLGENEILYRLTSIPF